MSRTTTDYKVKINEADCRVNMPISDDRYVEAKFDRDGIRLYYRGDSNRVISLVPWSEVDRLQIHVREDL